MKKVFFTLVVVVLCNVTASAQDNNEQMMQMMQMMMQMQKNNATGDGYGSEIKKSRIEELQFADATKLRAVGVGESRDASFARDLGEQNARAQMQRQIETFTKDALQRYRKQSQMDDAEKFMSNDENLSSTIAKGILTGCRIIDQAKYYNSQTKKYKVEVLVEYDKAGVMGLIESQDAEIQRNKSIFEAEMQNVFDEYELEKTGTTAAMRKQAAEDNLNEEKADRQAARENAARQQEADNNLRKQESNQNYNLKSQEMTQETAKKMQQQKIDGEVMKSNARNQKIEY